MLCTTKCTYYTANCADEETRLVGGTTDREGRVEVCVGGRRWRTVCTGSQDLEVTAIAVCLRIGIRSLVLEGDDHNYNSHLRLIAQLYIQEALWQ